MMTNPRPPRTMKRPAWAIDRRTKVVALAAAAFASAALLPCSHAVAQQVPDLVTHNVLRVCGDPANMPFSNRKGEGFESRIAELVAQELKIPLRYYWMPQGPGF